MTLSPYLSGALAAQEAMAEAHRDARRRRLVRSVQKQLPEPGGWLLRLWLGFGRRAAGFEGRRAGEGDYRPNQPIQSARV